MDLEKIDCPKATAVSPAGTQFANYGKSSSPNGKL
jgi:hypothetical protein